MMTSEKTFIPTRASLLSRLKDWGDHESWRVFFDTYWKLIYSTAVQAGLTDAEAQDVVQNTIISVLKSMPDFKYNSQKGSFKQWLLQLTRWRIADQLRKRRWKFESPYTNPRMDSYTSTESNVGRTEPAVDPEISQTTWDQEWEKNIFETAVERVKMKIDPRQYQLFDLYVFKQWSVSKITNTLNVSAGKIYLAKHRIGRLIKKEMNHLRTKPI